jgi:uncharacterized protein
MDEMMRSAAFVLASFSMITLLAGCAGNPLRSYDAELQQTVTLVKTGELVKAVELLEKNNTSMFSSTDKSPQGMDASGKPKEKTVLDSLASGKDILYYFEKGELLNLQRSYGAGRDAWLQADEVVRTWEDDFRLNPGKIFSDIGSFIVSDRVRRYDGQDYEKVFLSTRLTLNHILLGNFDHARIEMKKTYEREKLIESFREKEYDNLREQSEKQKVSMNTKSLAEKGYPMDELDTPDVSELKNGFQNAFAHYLAGYFFEVTGEYSLAEPGYRNALALQPHSQHIKQRLAQVGRKKAGPNESDVLFVVESGFAPAWKSVTIPLPIPTGKSMVITPLSFPVIKSEGKAIVPTTLRADGRDLPVETLVNVDSMARRLLKDQLPGILLRTTIRAVAKSVVQDQAQKKGGVVGGVIASVVSVATEQADERAWRTLPGRIAVARAVLPRGKVALEFQTGAGIHRTEVTVGNRFTIIPIRLTGGAVYVGQPEVALYDNLPVAQPSSNVGGVESKPKRPRSTGKRASVVK